MVIDFAMRSLWVIFCFPPFFVMVIEMTGFELGNRWGGIAIAEPNGAPV